MSTVPLWFNNPVLSVIQPQSPSRLLLVDLPSQRGRQGGPRRPVARGIAAVEFAVLLPVILLILLGSIEISRAIAVQHSLQEACVNGCRLYALGNKSQQQATEMVQLSLQEAGISGYSVSYNPPTKSAIKNELQPVSVTVSVPYSEVGVGIQWFLRGANITASVTLPVDDPPPTA